MAAKTKSELHTVTTKEYAKLVKLIEPIPDPSAMKKREEDIAIKDIIAHRAHWIDLFLGWYADGLAGKDVHFPAPGYKWNDLKSYNAALRERQADVDWPSAKAMLETGHAKLLAFIEDHSDEELYAGPMQGAKNNWTPGRWAEAAGPSHYRSAAKYIRAEIKND